MACRTDGDFSEEFYVWDKKASFYAVAEVDLPKKGHFFNKQMEDLFQKRKYQKCPQLDVT